MNIYEIDKAILNCIDEETGEIIDIDALEALQIERETKIDNIACWYKQLIAEAKAIKAEKSVLDGRQKAAEERAERLKKYISDALNGNPLKTARNDIKFRKSEAVSITNAEAIPTQYLRTKTAVEPDKTAIKEAIKSGVEVEDAELVLSNNVQIK